MSRKHYVAIAAALAETRPQVNTSEHQSWVKSVQRLADTLQADNERFNRDRFIEACLDEESA